LLEFVKILLEDNFAIRTRLRLQHKAGKTDSIINGRPITRTMDVYSLNTAGFKNSKSFSECINFSIKRKRVKLDASIQIFENFRGLERISEWQKRYYKKKNMWLTKDE